MGRFAVLCLLVACGRNGFGGADSALDGTMTGDSVTSGDGVMNGDGTGIGDGGLGSAVAYAGPAAQVLGSMGASQAFMITPKTVGDAVVIMLGCAGSQVPTGVTLTAPGWTFTALSPLTIDPPPQIAGASFGAIVPSTAPVTATVSWTNANCNRGKSMLADEFTNTDVAGGSVTFDAHAEAFGTGNCATIITTGNANDAVWAGCYSATSLTGSGAGYTTSASDGIGDFDEYKLTADPANTAEMVLFANTNGFVVVAASLKPR